MIRQLLASSLAILAALTWAPSTAFGAPNALINGVASPTAGTTATIFTFEVAYQSPQGFGAAAANAAVAGLTLPMTLVVGDPVNGTWRATSNLPAGTWQVVFTAETEKGSTPSLVGPTVVVTQPAPPSPPPDLSAPLPAEPAPVTAEPAPVIGTSSAPPPAAPGAPPVPPAAATAPASASSSAGAVLESTPTAEPDFGATITTQAPFGSAADSSLLRPSAEAHVGATGPIGDGEMSDLFGQILTVGLFGITAVALVGSALLFGRRRRDHESGAVIEADAAEPDSVVERRLRRARGRRTGDDPIVAAMGLKPPERRRRPVRAKPQEGE